MADESNRRGLGRGLAALMADVGPATDEAPRRAERRLPIERLRPNPDQPRRRFDPDKLAELTASIRDRGVIQPLIVRVDPKDPDFYQIVAGERRWRASQAAQLHDVPVIERDFTDTEVMEVAIIENVQRADLDPVEEAKAYQQLMDRFGHTQEKLAQALGKSRPHITNQLRLLQLPEDVQDYLASGALSAGHARALITSPRASELARQVVSKGLSVRATEKLVKAPEGPSARSKPASREKDADTRALEADLSAQLGMAVSIDHKPGADGGSVTIRYKDLEALDQLCGVLSRT